MIPIIICGGVGSKMWPLSSPEHPKHFLPLIKGKSLFELNWEMLRNEFAADEIYLQTNQAQAEIAMKLVPEIVRDNVFVEPEMRNQGPATGLAAALLVQKGKGNDPFFLIQVDNLRLPSENLIKMMKIADKYASSTKKYITGGFLPDRVVMGVDYLMKGKTVSDENGVKVYEVAEYVDRKEEDKIKQNLTSNRLLVHANHTCMTPNNLLSMYQQYRLDWYDPLSAIANGGSVEEWYGKMPKGAIEEITSQVHAKGESLVIELPFEWTDFGTWESVEKYYKANNFPDQHGGLKEIEGQNNYAISKNNKRVAVIGASDLIVVESDDGILICRRDLTGRVGEVA